MDRKQFIKATAFGAGFIAMNPLVSLAKQQALTKVTILHTNDTHARIEPFPEGSPQYGGLGGVARRAALIRKIRRENPASLLLDAGDVFQGTPYFNFYGGALDYQLMTKMGYDATTIGNHEFDNGIEGFTEVAGHAKFPFVSSNYDFGTTTMGRHINEFIIKVVGGVRIGIFGLGVAFENLVLPELHRGVTHKDPVETSKKMVRRLRQTHRCDMVICLSHIGYKYNHSQVSDVVVAQEVDGIDLIIGGHTHTLLEKPDEIVKENGTKTIIAQVGHAGVVLGRLDFYFDHQNKVVALQALNTNIDAQWV